MNSKSDDILSTRQRPYCCLCGTSGDVLYDNVKDRILGISGEWSLKKCSKRNCGSVWLDPVPLENDIFKAYKGYYTHGMSSDPLAKLPTSLKHAYLADSMGYTECYQGNTWKWASRMVSLIPTAEDMLEMSILGLKASERGKILDVGCGNGRFLSHMRTLGWETYGVEPDPDARKSTQLSSSIPVASSLEEANYLNNYFDVMTLDHTIEHMIDPVRCLKECGRILKSSGRIVLVTPNAESFGHAVFKQYWRGLETPRHINLFSQQAMRTCLEKAGLFVDACRTTARNARFSGWSKSRVITRGLTTTADTDNKAGSLLGGYIFQLVEWALCLVKNNSGEEIVISAKNARS